MKTSLLILGAFCIAYNLGSILHELGHGVAVWLSGGKISSIVLHPFSWNWISYHSNPNPLLASWGGVLFGVLFAVALSSIALLARSPFLTPLYLLAGCALATNGIYLAVAAVADVGDAGNLLSQGVPRAFLVAVGLFLMLLSFLWSSLIQPLIGIPADVPLGRRLLTLHAGITPYLIAMAAYALLFAKAESPLFLAFAGAGIVAVTAIAISGHVLRNVAVGLPRLGYIDPSWASAIVLLTVGIVVVVWELIYFAPQYTPGW